MKKLCINCRHYIPAAGGPWMYVAERCRHPENINPVTGAPVYAAAQRLAAASCGPEAALYEQREPHPDPPAPPPLSSCGMRPDHARGWWEFWR